MQAQARAADVDTAPLSLPEPPIDHEGLALLQRARLLLVRIHCIHNEYVAAIPEADRNGNDDAGNGK
jgi:hypothetical protein